MDNFLLVNDAYQRQIFQVNLKTAAVEAVDLPPNHEPIALAYDPFEVKVCIYIILIAMIVLFLMGLGKVLNYIH